MKILNSVDEIVAALAESKVQPPNKLTSTNYPDKVVYDCGCGDVHRVNDTASEIIFVSMPVKFVVRCRNDFVTFFQVKGIFKQTASSIWSCKSTLFPEAKGALGL